MSLALIFKPPMGLLSSPTRAPDQRQNQWQLGTRNLVQEQYVWSVQRRKISSILNMWNESVTPEKSNSQWECKTYSRGKPGGVHVGVGFSARNTVVAPTHYKPSIPVDTGRVVRQDFSMIPKFHGGVAGAFLMSLGIPPDQESLVVFDPPVTAQSASVNNITAL